MSELVYSFGSFFSLYGFDISDHLSLGEIFGKSFTSQSRQVESGQGDELEDESEFSQVVTESGNVLVC